MDFKVLKVRNRYKLDKKWKKVTQCETGWINKHCLYNYCVKCCGEHMCNGENERCKVASHLSRADTLTEERAGGEEEDGGRGGEEEGKRKMQLKKMMKRMMRWLVARKETEEGRRNTHLKKRKKMAVEMMKRMMGRMVSHTLRGRSK